jgi:hypothetical protein
MANLLDGHLYDKGWQEKKFDIRIMIDDKQLEIPTHSIDCYKGGVGIEVEWNNKDTFFDRDLNNFRLLFDLRALSVGVIITRTTKLQDLFKALVRTDGLSKDKFVTSTTHTDKLMPKVYSGAGGGCPLLIFGISQEQYREDE